MQKIIPRIYKQIPKTQEEIVHEPKIIQQKPITIDLEEIVHELKIIQQEPITQQHDEKLHRRILELEARVEGLVGTSSFVDSLFGEEVPTPMTQEEIATEPKIIQQVPMTQEEIATEPKIIQRVPMTPEEIATEPKIIPFSEGRTGRVLPFSPKSRDLYRLFCLQVLPSERHDFID